MISILNTLTEPVIGQPIPRFYVVKPGDILGWPNNKNKLIRPIIVDDETYDWECVHYGERHGTRVGASLQLGCNTRERTVYWGHEPVTEE